MGFARYDSLMRTTHAIVISSLASVTLCCAYALAQATPPTPPAAPAAAPPVATPPAATPPATPAAPPAEAAPASDPVKAAPAAKGEKSGAKVTPPPPPKTPAKKSAAGKKKEATETTAPAGETEKAAPPADDRGPEIQKFLKLAAQPKFKEFTKLAAERQALYKKSSALRMAMRTAEPTDAQRSELTAIQGGISTMGDRMDAFSSGGKWTQEDFLTMDFIISEQMRINPIE